MLVTTKDGVQKKMNVNLIDYMLGFTREAQLKKLLKEGVDPPTALATANGRPPKKPGKKPSPNTATADACPAVATKPANDTTNTNPENPATVPAQRDNAPPLAADESTSTFTPEQDERILKFKADTPAGKWEDLAKGMGMEGRGKELAERFRELKRAGRVVGGAGNGAGGAGGEKKGEEKKKDEVVKNGTKDSGGGNGGNVGGAGAGGGKKGKAGKDAAGGAAVQAAAGGTTPGGTQGVAAAAAAADSKNPDKATASAAATKNFSEAEMAILKNELVLDEELKGLRIASALFNRTGRDVHPEDVRAVLGF